MAGVYHEYGMCVTYLLWDLSIGPDKGTAAIGSTHAKEQDTWAQRRFMGMKKKCFFLPEAAGRVPPHFVNSAAPYYALHPLH